MKEYLGDAVYAELSVGVLVITTGDVHGGPQQDQLIYLEEEVYNALLRFVERAKKEGTNAPQ